MLQSFKFHLLSFRFRSIPVVTAFNGIAAAQFVATLS